MEAMRVIYCSGCDRDVRVVLAEGHERNGPYEELFDAECLEIGGQCTGTTCPICAVPFHARPTGERADETAAA
ncbi:MAG TPA: hypothetical protein VF142_04630 [Longimicrobium sp.]